MATDTDYQVEFSAELRDKITYYEEEGGPLVLKPGIVQCVVEKLKETRTGVEYEPEPEGFGGWFSFYKTEEEGQEEGEGKVNVVVYVYDDEFIAEGGHNDPPGQAQGPEKQWADLIIKYLKECADAQETKAGRRKSRKSKKTRKTRKSKKSTRRR